MRLIIGLTLIVIGIIAMIYSEKKLGGTACYSPVGWSGFIVLGIGGVLLIEEAFSRL